MKLYSLLDVIIGLICIICLVDTQLQFATTEASLRLQDQISRARMGETGIQFYSIFHPLEYVWICQNQLVDQRACLSMPEKDFFKRAALSLRSSRGYTPAVPPAIITDLLSTQSAELPGLQVKS